MEKHPFWQLPNLDHLITGKADCIIDDFLYLGDLESSESKMLQSKSINCVISLVGKSLLQYLPKESHLIFAVEDDETQSLEHVIPLTNSFIEKCRKNNQRVLVHCSAGISRSASVVIAYLMQSNDMSLKDAYMYAKSRRSVIAPNFGFMNQLKNLEKL